MKVWQCSVCKYIHRGKNPPDRCPVCNVPASKFKEIDEASIPVKPGVKRPPKKEIIEESSIVDKVQSLMVKHHAHPVSVHAPNGILPLVVLLWIGAWVLSYELFAKAAFINLVFVLLALPFVIFSGIIEWQKKYKGAFTKVFKKKIAAAIVTLVMSIVSIAWYIINPDVLSSSSAWLFILINVVMVIAVGIAGHIGGKLVFKD
jgi:rubredoxin/uncharacterized membrane protein